MAELPIAEPVTLPPYRISVPVVVHTRRELLTDEQKSKLLEAGLWAWVAVNVATGAALYWHGYKRHNGHAGWGLVYGGMGLVVPILPSVIATDQGWFKKMRGA